MKKILAAAILMTALFVNCASAEEVVDDGGAAVAPKEINYADSIYFMRPDFYNMTSSGDRVILTHYPTYQQKSDFSCGPACALTVLKYFGNQDYTSDHNQDGYTVESFDRFYNMWFDYNMLPEDERNQPWLIAVRS